MLSNLKIVHRLWLLVALTLAFIAVISVGAAFDQHNETIKERRQKAQALVENAATLVRYYGDLADSGKMDRTAARNQAKEAVGALRYDGNNYFFIADTASRIILHPFKPELEGQDLSEQRDENGVRVIWETVAAAMRGNREFVNYVWPRPEGGAPVPKLTTGALYAPWNWVIATGIFVDDVEAEFYSDLKRIGAVFLLASILLLLASSHIVRSITRPLSEVRQIAQRIASGDLSGDDTPRGHDELGSVLTSCDLMRESLIRHALEQKQIEQQLEAQNAQLEEKVHRRTMALSSALEAAQIADRTKDAFLANMSHELRTPLSAVIGLAGLAQNISSEPKMSGYLGKIVAAGKHLNHIINDLLDLSKIASGHMEFESITFSLRELIQQSIEIMAHRADGKGLALVATTAPTVPDVLVGDPSRIKQALLNLIGNAIKFTQSGRVEVRVGLDAHEQHRIRLCIQVEDSGIGMRNDDIEKLFKPFLQADASVSRQFGGTGLGLSITKRLAEMMGGEVSARSTEGHGSTFSIRIWLGLGDAANLQALAANPGKYLPKHYDNVRILVVDDQPINREIAEALLLEAGIVPRMATNGQEALDILIASGSDAFDLVLMDIEMPLMDGLTATRTLRSRAGFESLPIIAMTAHTMTHELEIGSAAGMSDHIGKPFDNSHFYRTLEKWIPAGRSQTSPAPLSSIQEAEFLATSDGKPQNTRLIDFAAGLARCNGKEDLYRRWLADYVEKSGEFPDQIHADLAAGNPDKAVKASHSFKGSVGMLGMGDLHAVVSALEHALRESAPVDDLMLTLPQLIGEVRDEVVEFLNAGQSDSGSKQPV